MAGDPIFIVGTERSGSNLLRLILDSHPAVVVPHPPHVMRYFTPLVPLYGDLSDEHRFRALVDDVLSLVATHIHPWPWAPEAGEVIARARRHDLLAVYRALHESVLERSGKARWGCKSTFMVDHVEAVLAEWPGARLIWLVRDPRDVAASSRESVFSTFLPGDTARLWTAQQTAALDAERRHPDAVLRVYYERLVGEPEAAVRRICHFLGEEFHPPMLEWFRGEEAKQSASLSESWANTAGPMRSESLQRWRKELSPEEVRTVESIAGPIMDSIGYTPSLDEAERTLHRAGAWSRFRSWIAGLSAWAAVEWRSLRKDKNVGRRYRRAIVLAAIRWRLVLRGR